MSHSPKVEEYAPKEDDLFSPYLFMVIHAVDYSRKDGVFATNELNFFLGKNFLVTYHEGPLRSVSLTEDRAVKGTMHIARARSRSEMHRSGREVGPRESPGRASHGCRFHSGGRRSDPAAPSGT